MTAARTWLKRHGHLILFLLPGLLLYGLFMAYPLVTSLSYSLSDWDGLVRKGFAGLSNFTTVLTHWPYYERFWGALRHNAIFFGLTLAIQTTLGLFLAAALEALFAGGVLAAFSLRTGVGTVIAFVAIVSTFRALVRYLDRLLKQIPIADEG